MLDIAAGPGTLALLAGRLGVKVVAIDFAPAMVARVSRRAHESGLVNVTVAVMDGQALALPDNSFDAAFSIFGLIFFPDHAAGFRELRRVVRPGGTAVVAAWSSELARTPFIESLARAKRHIVAAPPSPPASAGLANPDVFAQEMSAAGFTEIEIKTVVHRWLLPTPEAAWDAVRANPAMVAGVPLDRYASLRACFVEDLRTQFGPGPVPLDGAAHIGVGTK